MRLPPMFVPKDVTQHDDSTGQTRSILIHSAGGVNDSASVNEILNSEVEFNGRDEYLRAVLHCIVLNGSPSTVQVLLSNSAGTSLRDNWTFDEPDTPIRKYCVINVIGAMRI